MSPPEASKFTITIAIDPPFAERVDAKDLLRVARHTLTAEGVPAPAALAILVTDDDAVRDLNRRYRGLDEPTDVLSFGETSAEPGDDGGDWVEPDGGSERYLGDIAIAFPHTERQAAAAGRPVDAELAHLVVHGVLHLLGYDHAEPDEERVMRAKENAVLAARAAGSLSPFGGV